jgi:hypothetical protein
MLIAAVSDSQMYIPVPDTSAEIAEALLVHYSFDLGGYRARDLISRWRKQYPDNWLRLAVIEALYQGRYKAVSAQQILNLWHRRGQATYHFNLEFEGLICSNFPEKLTSPSEPLLFPTKEEPRLQENKLAKFLPSSRSASVASLPMDNNQESDMINSQEASPQQEEEKASITTKFLPASSIPRMKTPLPIFSRQSNIPDKLTKLLPSATKTPPIEQFTPESNSSSESFTSKLKSMSYQEEG